MKIKSKYLFPGRRGRKTGPTPGALRFRQRSMKKVTETVAETIVKLAESLVAKPVVEGFDPELLYVECGRCGSPVLWEDGRATRLLVQAGIDPLELDASCMLVTDACPACSRQDEYTVRIFRVTRGTDADLPPRLGHA